MECLSAWASEMFETGFSTITEMVSETKGNKSGGGNHTTAVFFASCALVLWLAKPRDELFSERVEMLFLRKDVEHCPLANIDVRISEA